MIFKAAFNVDKALRVTITSIIEGCDFGLCIEADDGLTILKVK